MQVFREVVSAEKVVPGAPMSRALLEEARRALGRQGFTAKVVRLHPAEWAKIVDEAGPQAYAPDMWLDEPKFAGLVFKISANVPIGQWSVETETREQRWSL